jgi:hypothetical protein
MLWVAFLHVRALTDEALEGAAGGFMQVASFAESRGAFLAAIESEMRTSQLAVADIEDIDFEDAGGHVGDIKAEHVAEIREALMSDPELFVWWGTCHTYPHDDA